MLILMNFIYSSMPLIRQSLTTLLVGFCLNFSVILTFRLALLGHHTELKGDDVNWIVITASPYILK